MPDGTASSSPRYPALDALRGTMMLAGVAFHAMLPYIATSAPLPFKDPDKHLWFDAAALLVHSAYVPAFLVAAGFFAPLLRDRRGFAGMTTNRFQRVVLPLVVGWLLLGPLTTAALMFAQAVADAGAVAAGIGAVLNWRWLRWDNPYHLWFLAALVVYYPLGFAVERLVRLGPAAIRLRLTAMVRGGLASAWRPLPLAVLLCAGFVPAEFWGVQTVGFVFKIAAATLYFAVGWVIYVNVDLLPQLGRYAGRYVVAALAVLPLAVASEAAVRLSWVDARFIIAMEVAAGVLFSLMSACVVFGLVGLFLTYARRPNPVLQYLRDASYWIYLVHLPLVVVVGGVLSATGWPAALKLATTLAVAGLVLLLSYHFLVRRTAIGALLNGRRTPRPSEKEAQTWTDAVEAR